ncbi:hypothetical protein ACFFJT_14355 [Dyella flava]|uniref:Uncharacterized protein n=1 Tax=Dyella flava TaxID=1920170 RepID=A0ABS2K1C5_9GAMM|nr:hypothetical protein [Dyella flava]MBM7125061.1 hypothetical protein [Dyella flava]GLQ51934.1 hypothetical protein GCM10010872_33830 [Dyella flava]
MRIIPVANLLVEITTAQFREGDDARWRGHWSVHPGPGDLQQTAVAEGDTDLYTSEEHAYLFASTEGVAIAKDIAARLPGH